MAEISYDPNEAATLFPITITPHDLDGIRIAEGGHANRAAGVCAMEAVAWLAGEPHSDTPACVCPVLARFIRHWNDELADDDERTRVLRPILPALVGTAADRATLGGNELRRLRWWGIFSWYVREALPAWLKLAGLDREAHVLADLSDIRPDTVPRAVIDLGATLHAAAAARVAAIAHARKTKGRARDCEASAYRTQAKRSTAQNVLAAMKNPPDDTLSADELRRASAFAFELVNEASCAAVERGATDAQLRATVAEIQASACAMIRRLCELTPTDAAGA
jgi:hypothetical protein